MAKKGNLPKNITIRKDGRYCYRYKIDGKTVSIYSWCLDELLLLKEANFNSEPNERFNHSFLEKRTMKNFATTEKQISKVFPEEQFVYFVSDGRYVKIGVSKDVFRRVRNMQTGNSSSLKIIYVIKTHAPYLIEYALHQILKNKCVIGEWYDILDLFENGEEYAINEA